MSEPRKRNVGAGEVQSKTPLPATSATASKSEKSPGGFGVVDVLRILGGLVLLNCALSYFVTGESISWGWRPWYSKPASVKAWLAGPVQLTDLELLAYDGSDPNKPIYVALNGSIYDVSAGRQLYGPGGSYHFFAGKDGARAFVTGCFDTDLTPDLRGAELTYVPVDPDEDAEDVAADGELRRKGGKKGISKAELKIRNEREYRLARKRVQETIEGWAKMFRGEGGKNYFHVGEVKRAPGWIDALPKRELCERAQKQRPKRQE